MLDQEARIAGTMLRKSLKHLFDKGGDALVVRVHNLKIAMQLQRHQEEVTAPRAGGLVHNAALFASVGLLAPTAAGPGKGLPDDPQVAMVLVVRIAKLCRRECTGVDNALPGEGTKGAADLLGFGRRPHLGYRPAIQLRVFRHRGVAVYAVALKGDVIRAQVAFLKDPDRNTELAGNRNHRLVHGPAIADQKHRVNLSLGDKLAEVGRPLIHRIAIGDRLLAAKEDGIAAIEIDLSDASTVRSKLVGKALEERTNRSLQKQCTLKGHGEAPWQYGQACAAADGANSPAASRRRSRERLQAHRPRTRRW